MHHECICWSIYPYPLRFLYRYRVYLCDIAKVTATKYGKICVKSTHIKPKNKTQQAWHMTWIILGTKSFPLMYAWTNGWANNRDAGDLRRHRAHHDVTVIESYDDVMTWLILIINTLWGDPLATGEFPFTRANNAQLWCFLVSCRWFETPWRHCDIRSTRSCWHFIVKPKRQLSVLWMH